MIRFIMLLTLAASLSGCVDAALNAALSFTPAEWWQYHPTQTQQEQP